MENNKFSTQITSSFLEEYKKLESIEKTDPARYDAFRDKYLSYFELFRQARNCLVHTPKLSSDYPFLISLETLNLMKTLIRKMSRTAEEECIKVSKIETISLDKPLHDALTLMNEKNYTYLPVFNEKKQLAYVVSEKSILNILSDNSEGIVYDEATSLRAYQRYFAINANPNEYYAFLSRKAFAYQARNMFLEIKDGKKCGVIFITENGTPLEAVLGLITAWDVYDI